MLSQLIENAVSFSLAQSSKYEKKTLSVPMRMWKQAKGLTGLRITNALGLSG
jgi:hypothetical protein